MQKVVDTYMFLVSSDRIDPIRPMTTTLLQTTKDNALAAICDALFMAAVNGQPAPSAETLTAIYEAARLALDGTTEQARTATAALESIPQA